MNFQWKPKKYLITLLKVIGWISLSIIALLILVAVSIQIPYIQNRLVQKAVSFLHEKIGTEVRLEHISLSIPKKIVLTGLYLEDQKKDTLLYAGELAINTDLWQLTNHTIQLNDVELSNFKGSVRRSKEDSTFNFTYIINAFSGDTTVVTDTTQTPWKFSVGNISLENIALSFHDALEQNDMELVLGTLEISMEEFNLEQSIIKADQITLENVKMRVDQQSVPVDTLTVAVDSTVQHEGFSFGVNTVSIKNVEGSYNHMGTGQNVRLTLGELLLEAETIDLKKHDIRLDKFSLQNTFISYHQMAGYSTDAIEKNEPSKSDLSLPWIIHLDDLMLSNNSFQYHNFDQPFQKGAVDFNHLWVTNLNTEAEGLKWEGSAVTAKVANLSFKDRSGFTLESFSTTVALTEHALKINDLKFRTPHTRLFIDGEASFESLQTIAESYPEATVRLSVDNSIIGLQDIRLFAPGVMDSLPLTIPQNANIALNTQLDGQMKNLSVENLKLQILGSTILHTNGNVKLQKDQDPLVALTLDKFYTTEKDIRTIIPDTMLPSSIALPEWLNLTGTMTGTFRSPTVDAILTSNFGKINLDASLNQNASAASSEYTATLNMLDFHIGKLLKQQAMGPISLTLKANGTGLTMEDIDAQVLLKIQRFVYQGYTYQNFTLDGSLKKYFFEGLAQLQDKNIDFNLRGDLNYNEDIPKYNFSFELKNADFKALHLSERPLKARGTLDVNLATSDFKIINGNLDIRKVAIFNGQDMYAVDSLLFASIDLEGQSEISIRSDIIDGNFEGTINLHSLPEVIRRHFDSYFSLQDKAYNKPAQPQDFKFDLTIKNTDLITEILIPELDPFIPGEIKGEYDSRESTMNLSMELAKIRYNGIGTDSITFHATSDKNLLAYDLSFRKIQMDTLRIEALSIEGTVAQDSIRTKLVILDSLQKDKYILGGVFHSLEKVFQFHFLQDEVVMNYAPWKTPEDNALRFTSHGIQAHNFSITNINEVIALNTTTDKDSTVSVVFKDLNLQNITKLVEGTTPIDGLANGDFNMMVADNGAFNSELRINKLVILDQLWGDLRLALGRTNSGPLNFDLRLEGDNTSLKAAGYYTADPSSPQIELLANIEKFDLASIDPLTRGILKNTQGQMQGEVSVSGSTKRPDIDGALRFKNASFTPALINSQFTLENETITINNDEIIFENFKLKDPQNNLARLNGKITSSKFQDFNFNLGLTATNFQILNSTEKDNELFYGNVRITTKANITGPVGEPTVNMQIDLSEESNFTYVVPQSEKGVLEQKGIVRFVDRDAKDDPFLASINPQDTIKSNFRGINLSANIELNDKETFNIIIDPATGDKLTVKGNSTLTLDIDPTGDMVLSGRYEISEGSYDLSFYKLVKRKFLIEKGSTITWAGSPLDATMNIRAIYEVETSPMELMVNQEDEQVLNQYRQRLPFMVYLQIKGELLTPEISFQLDLAEASRNAFGGIVYAKIRDINTRESELNKQVFALLLLKRFISDNPLDNRAGSDVASTARRSVSKLLTEQLNRLSENVKGVELSFDVKSYEDYSTGGAEGQTQVQLGLSKSLMDDRLIVKVSGNFEVEGETSNQNSVSDYIGDLALEYKLTEDGRFRITGFRNSNFDMINGELIETGVGLIYIKDYNTLRELFKANAKNK